MSQPTHASTLQYSSIENLIKLPQKFILQVKGGPGGAALTVATTHMSSLARLKLDIPHRVFENASAEFDDELLSPTYRLLWGVPGRSCALSVAAGLGVPQAIIDEAKEVVGTSQVRLPIPYWL